MKKDDYLVTVMQAPPKQHIPIVQFDMKTQKEAFTVSAEGLKGVCFVCTTHTSIVLIPLSQWNAGALILESAQAREDRKKRVSITPSSF